MTLALSLVLIYIKLISYKYPKRNTNLNVTIFTYVCHFSLICRLVIVRILLNKFKLKKDTFCLNVNILLATLLYKSRT